ncbi:MAG: 5-formyltetrahydrofolate cyclo-ligase [Thermoproteales archaeon]|nr:5-formyltetrahydrofolate cyclo-ligase [Thermoproteales archaeon]
MDERISREKERIREHIWRLLLEEKVARFPLPVRGRIPNFAGSIRAAIRLAQHEIFSKAKVVFVSPDSPQRPVRELVLKSGKILVMATPKLREGFLILHRKNISPSEIKYASTIRGAFRYGIKVELPDYKIDLKVTGSVAVTLDGRRLGKGGGYSDLEYAILRETGNIDNNTIIATTVHDLQIVEHIPVTRHDVFLDYIFTPTRTIRTSKKFKNPSGIILEELDEDKIAKIPILKKLLTEKFRK